MRFYRRFVIVYGILLIAIVGNLFLITSKTVISLVLSSLTMEVLKSLISSSTLFLVELEEAVEFREPTQGMEIQAQTPPQAQAVEAQLSLAPQEIIFNA